MNLFVTIGLGLLSALFSHDPEPQPPKTPKNIILMIGDGMGLTQVSAGLYSNHNKLNLERFPVAGLITTNSAKNIVTDSGAGATAFACGCKSFNTAIGVDRHKKPCRTILEQADSLGKAVGIAVTCSATHATPGSFVAHVADRKQTEAIAAFYLDNQVDLLIGGGKKLFEKRTSDQRNLVQELQMAGYEIVDYRNQPLKDCKPDPLHPFVWFAADEEPPAVTEGRNYLPDAARLAPDFLKKRSDKGFFLMIEGSQIDWACHANDGRRAVAEMLDFDKAIGEVLRFAEADGETLVIVTADHETGGMAIQQGSELDSLELAFTTKNHTASMVPVFAYGPGAERFGGVYDNTRIYWLMRGLWGF